MLTTRIPAGCDNGAWETKREDEDDMPIRSVMRQGLKRAVITGGLEFAHLAERVGLMASARGMGR